MVKRIRNAVSSLLSKEPARTLGAVAAALTFAADVLQVGDVHTWQAAIPVLFSEVLRRLVFSPDFVRTWLASDTDDDA
jgi:hypothetical protein